MPRRFAHWLLLVSTAAFAWLAMLAVHELGHVLHALVSGGTVTKVILHPLTISRTDVSPNPAPHFVAWGGAVWGCLLPAALGGFARGFRTPWAHLASFVAGFCLIANGAYLGSGFWFPVGDAAELLQLGTPRWLLGAFGSAMIAAGLWFWNGLGPQFGLGRNAIEPNPKAAFILSAIVMAIMTLECAISDRL